jgi:hypothetical protein
MTGQAAEAEGRCWLAFELTGAGSERHRLPYLHLIILAGSLACLRHQVGEPAPAQLTGLRLLRRS